MAFSDTIVALSSGAPPAAIAVVRVSGPEAGKALERLAGSLPKPRLASLRTLRAGGEMLDRALVLWLPGPHNATGEDCAELHLHAGRAVIEAVTDALVAMPGLRAAEAGEFTRRAFAHGRMDLAEAEGLADLLEAETELERKAALAMAGGALSTAIEGWLDRLLGLSARVEAVLDFSDEDDVAGLGDGFRADVAALADDLAEWLAAPRAEHLREGYRVALAGPPNAGKSTLFNALLDEEAAIVTERAGTTRDVLARSVAIQGVPFTIVDMAGLRNETADPVEAIGIARAGEELGRADCVLWLGPEGDGPEGAVEIDAQCDLPERAAKSRPEMSLSAVTGEGMTELRVYLVRRATTALLPPGGIRSVTARQHSLLREARDAILRSMETADPLLAAENLRIARVAFDRITGRDSTEAMLDGLFGRFCIGK